MEDYKTTLRRLALRDECERGLAGRRLAEELEARGRVDHVADAATERLVVVDGHDPDG